MLNHQNQWKFLTKSVELGRLAHALLFSGQEHLGKKTLAVKFANFLNSRIYNHTLANQGSRAKREVLINGDIEKGIHPDFILVEPEGKEIQIAQIRNLIQKLSFKPYLADFKIAIIDNAHLMTQEAQNCFLKFLEEPRDKTFLILVTAYPSLLLPTILSRVQKIRFFPTKDFELKLTAVNEGFISDLIKVSDSDLSSRFQYAKDISKESLEEILDTWLRYFRKIFISRLRPPAAGFGGQAWPGAFNQYSLTELKDIIRQIQSTKLLISTTNANPRLALEVLLMKL